MLALAHIGRELHHVAIGPAKRLVAVEQGLDPVATRREVAQARDRVSERSTPDDRRLSRRQSVDVDAEDQLGFGPIRNLKTRLFGRVAGDEKQQAAVQRSGAPFAGEAHGKAGPGHRAPLLLGAERGREGGEICQARGKPGALRHGDPQNGKMMPLSLSFSNRLAENS